jgi:hypothetical protein
MTGATALVWFKRDLRVRDHASLVAGIDQRLLFGQRGRRAGRPPVFATDDCGQPFTSLMAFAATREGGSGDPLLRRTRALALTSSRCLAHP